MQEERGLSPLAFSRLLKWLDDGPDSNGESYLEMRRRLVGYFDRRNRRSADELADETLNRVARTLEADGAIAVTPPARYCYIIARFVLLEDLRRDRATAGASGIDPAMLRDPRSPVADDEARSREHRLACLDRCLQELRSDQRELVLEYLPGQQAAENRVPPESRQKARHHDERAGDSGQPGPGRSRVVRRRLRPGAAGVKGFDAIVPIRLSTPNS